MATFQPLLAFLILTTFLGGVIGWLARKLKDGRQLDLLQKKLVNLRETVTRQKTEINTSESKNDYINAIVSDQPAPIADASFNSEYDRLIESEKDLRIKLSQLYAKKQSEIEKISTRVVDLEGRLNLINSESTIEVFPDDVNNELAKHLQLRLDKLEAEKQTYETRIEQLESESLNSPIKESKSEIEFEKTFPKKTRQKKTRKSKNKSVHSSGKQIKNDTKDDLTLINGIGPKIQEMLFDRGINSFEKIAALKAADIKDVGEHLGNFGDRIKRDEWVKQARQLLKNGGKVVKRKPRKKTTSKRKKASTKIKVDDLTKIGGIGEKIADMLNENGIYSYEQLAKLKTTEITILSERLGSFGDRIKRDNWVKQAKKLSE